MIQTALMVFSLVIFLTDVIAHNTPQEEQKIAVFMDDSAARFVLENPENALENRDTIWNTFEEYRITKVWHEESSYPVTWKLS